jgi:hypothetical protein
VWHAISKRKRHPSGAVKSPDSFPSRVGVRGRVSHAAPYRPPLSRFLNLSFLTEMPIYGPFPFGMVDETSMGANSDPGMVSKEEEEELLKDTADELPISSRGTGKPVPMEGVESSEAVITVSDSVPSKRMVKRQREKQNRRNRKLAEAGTIPMDLVTPATSRTGGKRALESSSSPATEYRERNPPNPKKLFTVAVVSDLRIQITFSDMEKGGLTLVDLNSFRQALEGQIFACKTGLKVKVESCALVNGVGEIFAGDEDTVKWIHDQVGSLLGGAYKAWNYGELPRPKPIPKPKLHRMWCWVSGSNKPDPKSFFTGIALQNDLVTSRWRLNAVIPREGGHTVLFGVDDESLEALKGVDFRPYYGMGRLSVQRVGPSRGKGGIGTVGKDSDKPP